ncbi:cytochrome P450 71D10-like [Neltuma alba]|uniref:cytochrome P450 71D10-like n=1 Tax=Neltuma alba TaxID=207710 RepID=UPI0010A3BAC9|nr:cytochrome P450 71D10-like [Prosopis alba]XP_028803069.1 cytochrome P450 71D10-like [Prosopis alba]
MEMQIPYSIIFFTFFCFFFVIHKLSSSAKSIKTLPPGPWKLPLIGNMHQLIGSLPHRSLANLANKYGPFMHLKLGQISHIIVSSPEYAKEIMKTHDQIFVNRPRILASDIFAYNSTDIIFSPYGNYWRQLRKICTLEIFSAKRVQSFRRIREEEISALVSNIAEHEGSFINLSRKISTLTNSVVARTAFGTKTQNVEQMLEIMEQTIKLSSGLSISDLYPSLKFISVITGTRARIMKLHKEGDKVFDDIIRDHREKKRNNVGEAEEDLVDILLTIQKDNDFDTPFSLDNVKAVLKDIFFAGTQTTATTTEWAMSELLRNPKVMKEAQEEVRRVYGSKGYVDESNLHQLKYLNAVIKETLRLRSPLALLVPRENSESCEINGYVIPPRTKIIINAWAIGRDPKNWNDPETFEPKRFLNTMVDYNFKGSNFEYIPFGAGRRTCPGSTFAMPILELLLSNLLYHFDWKLPKGMRPEELDMDESFGGFVRKKNNLILAPIGYSS